MRTFLSFTAALVLAPTLAFAQEAPPAPAAPEAPATTVPAAPAAPDAPLAAPAAPPVTIVVLPAGAQPPAVPAYAAPLAPMAYAPLAPDPVVMRRRNPKLMVGGLVMIPVGLGMLIGGLAWAAQINAKPSSCNPSSSDPGTAFAAPFCALGEGIDRAMGSGLAYSIAITGGGVALAGGIMTGVGASMVPAKPRWMPQPAVGAGTVSLTWKL
ncbi:MAG: hypothetical protein QM820_27475 [Minicystis sp.]